MAATVTATGTAGPGFTVTAGVFTGIVSVSFDTVKNLLRLVGASGQIIDIDINAATTITATKSASTYTFTIS